MTIVVCLKMSVQDDIFDPWEKDPAALKALLIYYGSTRTFAMAYQATTCGYRRVFTTKRCLKRVHRVDTTGLC